MTGSRCTCGTCTASVGPVPRQGGHGPGRRRGDAPGGPALPLGGIGGIGGIGGRPMVNMRTPNRHLPLVPFWLGILLRRQQQFPRLEGFIADAARPDREAP